MGRLSLPQSPHLAQHPPVVQGNGAGDFYLLWREGLGQKAKGAASVKVLVKFLTPLRLAAKHSQAGREGSSLLFL